MERKNTRLLICLKLTCFEPNDIKNSGRSHLRDLRVSMDIGEGTDSNRLKRLYKLVHKHLNELENTMANSKLTECDPLFLVLSGFIIIKL